jgi:hypothetical protein
MRLVKISAPAGSGEKVMKTAFEAGIESVTVQPSEKHSADGRVEKLDMVNLETSTPNARRFLDDLLASDYFDSEKFDFNIREPRTISNNQNIRSLTVPLTVPPTDLWQELWQFSQITYGLVLRVAIASCLLAYGMIRAQLLAMIAGLLFIPVLPIFLAIAYGTVTGGQRRLALQGLLCFLVCLLLFVGCGAAVASLSSPPLRFDEFPTTLVSFAIVIGVGTAAGLGAIDDVGRRELIGLAAASQISLVPTWLGITLVFGLPAGTDNGDATSRLVTYFVGLLFLVLCPAIVFWLTRAGIPSVRRLKQ